MEHDVCRREIQSLEEWSVILEVKCSRFLSKSYLRIAIVKNYDYLMVFFPFFRLKQLFRIFLLFGCIYLNHSENEGRDTCFGDKRGAYDIHILPIDHVYKQYDCES